MVLKSFEKKIIIHLKKKLIKKKKKKNKYIYIYIYILLN